MNSPAVNTSNAIDHSVADTNEPDNEPRWDTNDVSDFTGLSVHFFEKARWLGTGPPYVKIGRRVRYRPRAAREWFKNRCVDHATSEATATQAAQASAT